MAEKAKCSACNGTGRWRGCFGGPDWPQCTSCNGTGKADYVDDDPLTVRAMVDRNKLIAVIRQFADPANWYEKPGLQQWMGKRDARDYAAEVLKEVEGTAAVSSLPNKE